MTYDHGDSSRTSETATEPTLRYGDDNPDGWVEYLQSLLLTTDGTLALDGDFGNRTRRAVVEFQTANDLLADGVVGNQTWAALRREAPRPIGTDGRAPHCFQERGVEARWYVENDIIVHNPDLDQVESIAISTGDTVIPADHHFSRFTIDGPQGTIDEGGWGHAFDGGDVQVGELFIFVLANFRERHGPGEYRAIVKMPPELGGDESHGVFTVE